MKKMSKRYSIFFGGGRGYGKGEYIGVGRFRSLPKRGSGLGTSIGYGRDIDTGVGQVR
jgi:hypothetical protein